ncbi:retrotransposon protein, putative, unclassified [Tanacetum coccineum]
MLALISVLPQEVRMDIVEGVCSLLIEYSLLTIVNEMMPDSLSSLCYCGCWLNDLSMHWGCVVMKIWYGESMDNDRVNSSPTMFTPVNSVVNKEDNLCGVNDGLKTNVLLMLINLVVDREEGGVDVIVPMESIRAISERFANTAYGFFMGSVPHTPLSLTMIGTLGDLDAMFENGLWFIYNNPLILKKWNPDVNLLKEDVSNVPVWVKLHGVPVTAFSDDGLSAIATKLGTPLMLNSYTSDMHVHPIIGNSANSSGNKKIYAEPTIEVSNTNPFDVLNSVENDVDLGTTSGTSNLVSKKVNSNGSLFWNMESSSTSTTHIIEKIDKVERLIIMGKVTLVDDEGKPVTKVDSLDDHDNEDEVVSTDIDMANFLPSKKEGYGTNSLLEQWNESYVNGDYDFNSYNQWRIQESEVGNHITYPHCEAFKTVPEAGQSSMARDGSVFVYNPDVLREQFTGLVIQQGLPFNHL